MDNKNLLLDMALQAFSARGYDAVGIQEIVDQTQVTKPTLYHYFGSKTGLLDAVLARDFGDLLDLVEEACSYHHDLVLNLTQLARVYFRFASTHEEFYRMILGMQFAAPDSDPQAAVSGYIHKQQQLLEQLFLKATFDHGNMRGRHTIYAASYLGMLNTYIGLAMNGSIHLGEDVIYRAVHQFMHGIFS